MKNIVVIGSLNMDLILRVPRLPVPGETILGTALHYACGGKGANQAYTLGKLGARAVMLGSVGRDEHGGKLLDNLRSVNVNVDSVQRLEDAPSGLAAIGVDDAGNNSIIVAPGANLRTTPDYIYAQKGLIARCDALIMQLEIPIESVAAAARLAKEMGKLVILDPAPAAALPDELYQYIDIIKPNEIELAHLSGQPVNSIHEAERATGELLKRGAGAVVATLGGEGALIAAKDRGEHIPVSQTVKVVDTTAAGDSFTAAMTMLLAEGRPLKQAVEFATQVAAIVVSRPGAQTSIPSADEVAAMKG